MKRLISAIFVASCVVLPFSERAEADIWGADVAVLTQILAQTMLELAQLKEILQSGNDTLGLLQDVNRGINDSLDLAQTLGLRVDPGIYKDLKNVGDAVRIVQDVYGKPPNSLLEPTQQNTDQTVAEAISFNNDLNDYAARLDQIGEEIKTYSHAASPGGAQKLTAESLGVVIHVLNQQLRASGQGLKLQAQAMAVQNKKEKDETAQYLNQGQLLKQKMVSLNPTFSVPRF
jgi:hypothetical protein